MKKQLVLLLSASFIIVGLSCEKKNDSNAISPDYSATGNPNPNHQTVTGSNTYTNPATENTSLHVGVGGWSNLTCSSTNSATLKGFLGDTDVTLSFAGVATSGTYAIAQVPSKGACAMTVVNAPNQPAGIVWVGKTGIVVVKTNTASINATFDAGVICTQKTFNFPVVSVTGTLSCN